MYGKEFLEFELERARKYFDKEIKPQIDEKKKEGESHLLLWVDETQAKPRVIQELIRTEKVRMRSYLSKVNKLKIHWL